MGENLKHTEMYNSPANLIGLDKNKDIEYEVDFINFYASLLK